MVRVLLADDAKLVRLVLRDLLARDPDIEVVGEAVDGQQAVTETIRLHPDLVIIDVHMPVMDGLAAVQEIMATCPTPILVLSANIDPHDSRSAFNAIRHGALDVLGKPQGTGKSLEQIAGPLIEKVKSLARVKVIHHYRPRRESVAARVGVVDRKRDILAIGASTGGPPAVLRLLKEMRQTAARILIVQHIAEGFAEGFAEWLSRESGFRARIAVDGEPLQPGCALVAPSGSHLRVREEHLVLGKEPPVNSCRPAVDILFASLAASPLAGRVVAVLLTGMGRDGAEGLAALRRSGAHTIAQDEGSSVIFGMPRAAIELGAAIQVLPLAQIPPALHSLLRP